MRNIAAFLSALIALIALLVPHARAACPTPGGAGYSCQNSSGGVPYSFEDISSSGIALGIPDDRSAIIPVGFTFNYFGTDYTHVSVTDNGHLDFAYGWGNESPNDSNLAIPQPSNTDPFASTGWGMDPLIAVWFDDLDPFVTGGVFYEVRGAAPDRRLIVQWNAMMHISCSSSDPLTFQAVLFESTGSILMQYEDATTSGCLPGDDASKGASATVGLDLDGSTGLQYSANAASITNGLAILFEHGSAPVISASATSINFGFTNTGGSDSRAIMLRNTGGSLLFFQSIGGLSSEFSLDADTCSGAYLQPGQSCGLGVSFSPTVDGALSNTLSITSNATVIPLNIALSGIGNAVAGPDITVTSPASLVYDFGNVDVGAASNMSVAVGNDGTSDLNMTGMGVNNTPAGDFGFTSADCVGAIAQGNVCARTLRFMPLSGGVQTSFFDIASDDPDEGSLIVFVRGTGVVQSVPKIVALDSTQPTDDNELSFGTMAVGTTATQSVRIINEGTGPLSIGATTVDNASFAVTQNTCASSQLPAGGSCAISIKFGPSTALAYGGTLTINSNDPDAPALDIALSGTGTSTPTPQIGLTDPIAPTYDLRVPFGQSTTGASYSAALTIRNTGNAALLLTGISASGAAFSTAAGSCASATLASGESCSFTVYFKPLSDGSYSGSVSIKSNDPDTATLTVALSGSASSPAVPDVDVSDPVPPANDLALDFGSAQIGSETAKTVIVRNLGTKGLQIGIIYATGGAFDIGADQCSASVLAPGASCSFEALYAPTGTAGDTGSVVIPSDDPDENPSVLSLSGTGTASAAPDVYVIDPAPPANDLSLHFGQAQTGASLGRTIHVGNSGNAPLSVSAVATTNPLAAPFSMSEDGCTGATLPVGGLCPITIMFSPSVTALASDAFNITTNDPDMPMITFHLSGQGSSSAAPSIYVSDGSAPSNDMVLDFGEVSTGQPRHATHWLSVLNDGSANLAIGPVAISGSPFIIKSDACSSAINIAPSASCLIEVEFNPISTGPQSGWLSIASDDPDAPQLRLTLVGWGVTSAVPDISVASPASLHYAFGRLLADGLPAAGSILVSNEGWATLLINGVAAPAAPFSIISDTCDGAYITQLGTCSIGISFDPQALGSYSGAITITSDDPDEPEVTIALSGTYLANAPVGSPPTAPVLVSPANGAVDVSVPVTFAWEPSTDPDGETVTYELAYSTDSTMAGATVITVASAASADAHASSAGGAGLLMIAAALVLGAGSRRRLAIAIVALALIGMLAACGNGTGSSGSGGTPVTPTDQITQSVDGLLAGTTYYWSVTAVDASGNRTGSGAWSFTTAN